MIAKVKAVSHGSNLLSYNTGQSKHKEHPEKIHRIKDNFLPQGMDASGIWDMVRLRTMDKARMKNTMLRFELSPDAKHTRFFTHSDWAKLWDDFIAEYDAIELYDPSTGKIASPRTNIAGSMYTVWLHEESKSGIPHLHGAVCRVDEQGRTNNDHHILSRAQMAADNLAIKRGWRTAKQVRRERICNVSRDCEEVLQSMRAWNPDDYFKGLARKGYTVYTNPDKSGKVHGYAIGKDFAKYKASELGIGRRYTASKLESTWQMMHKDIEMEQEATLRAASRVAPRPVSHPSRPVSQPSRPASATITPQMRQQQEQKAMQDRIKAMREDYKVHKPGRVSMDIEHGGSIYHRFVPMVARDIWDEEFDSREVGNWEELTNLAAAVFTMLIAGGEQVQTGGRGGSQSDLPWRDKDEDDRKFAMRCANYAKQKLGVTQRWGRRR